MRKPDTLRERAAQLLMPRLGSNMPPARSVSDDVDRVKRLLDTTPVGGLVLFRGNFTSTPAAIQELQAHAPTPLVIGSDLERGAGQQLAGAAVFPHAMAFGRLGPDAADRVREAARITASQARQAGVHWIFAPVADVHSNPVNPIISTRAYGSSPAICSPLVRAFIEGCRLGGGISTAKHFPGHGDTDTDSHDALPTVSRSREELDRLELLPFRAAFDAGVDSVMTAHVAYPALDAHLHPATFSPAILRTLLRQEMGFDGVVISDSLLMGAAGREVSERAPDLVAAGVDVLLDISHPEVALAALLRAVADGRLQEALVHEAFERVWAVKVRAFAAPPTPSHTEADAASFANSIASQALSVEGDASHVLSGDGPIPVIVVRPHTDYPDPTRADTPSVFVEANSRFRIHQVGPDTTPDEYSRILEAATGARRCVAALVVKPAAWHKFGLLAEQEAFLNTLLAHVSTVLCSLGSPDADRNLPTPAARIVAYSDVEASVRAVAAFLSTAVPSQDGPV